MGAQPEQGGWDGRERRDTTVHQEILDAITDIRSKQEVNSTMLRQCVQFITGNGHPERGAVVRMDRLEQLAKTIVWVVSTIGVAVTGMLVNDAAQARSQHKYERVYQEYGGSEHWEGDR